MTDWGWKGLESRALELPSGENVAPAPPKRARIRYNSNSNELELSVEEGPYGPLIPTGAGPWNRSGTTVFPDSDTWNVVVGDNAMSASEKFRSKGIVQFDLGAANQFMQFLTTDAFARSQIWHTGPSSVLRLGADTADGDAFDADSEGIVVYNISGNHLGRIKADRFGLTRPNDSSLYYFRVDETALFYRANPPAGTIHLYINRATGFIGMGTNSPVGSELLRVAGGALVDPYLRIEDPGGTAAFLELDAGDSAAVSVAGEARLRYDAGSDQIQISKNGGAYAPLGGAGGGQIDVSFAFRSVFAGAGEVDISGFYSFAGTANDFNPSITFGTVNVAYAAHLSLIADSPPGGDTTVRVAGTSITDAGVRTPGDTEDVAFFNTDPLNTYKETVKKWIGQVTISKQAGTDRLFNYGWSKYWDNNNQNFTFTGFEFTWWGGGNDAAADLIIYHHKATGWTFNAAAPPGRPTPVAQMTSVYGAESNVANNEPGAFKRTGLSVAINGNDSEGLIGAAIQSLGLPFDSGTLIYTVTQ